MKGGVTIPIHKEFIHPSTFGATHQGVLWQHPVPKDARFFGSNFLWAILVNVVTTSKDHLIHGNGPRCSPVEKSHHHLRCIFEKLLSWRWTERPCFFCLEKLRCENTKALRSRHGSTRDALEVSLKIGGVKFGPLKERGPLELFVGHTCPTRLFGRLGLVVLFTFSSRRKISRIKLDKTFLNQIPSKPTGTSNICRSEVTYVIW